MKKLIFLMAFAIFSFSSYSQADVIVFNNTHLLPNPPEVLTIGVVSCMQVTPCTTTSSGSITGVLAGTSESFSLPGQIIQRVGAGGISGSGFSMSPWISYGGCVASIPGPYTFTWIGPSIVIITN
jgi:hypothetical protein